jgi:hypothetical protein
MDKTKCRPNTLVEEFCKLILNSRHYMFVFTFVLLCFCHKESHATEYNFQSAQDNFIVSVEGGVAKFNSEIVSGSAFAAIKPLFELNLSEVCDKISGRPDVTITRIITNAKGEKKEKRLLYYEQGLVSNGSHCATISGSNLYSLPIHRDWFVGKNQFTIGLTEGFSIWTENKIIIDFVKTKNGFRNKDKSFFTNWDFFSIFKDSLTDFKVDYRIHPAGLKNNIGYELRSKGKSFKFAKVGIKTWAVQFPGSSWYAASGQFGIFEDMKPHLWISPLDKQLRMLKDSSATLNIRLKVLSILKTSSSSDLKVVLQDMLIDPNEPMELKSEIVNIFKYKPTDDNFNAIVEALSNTKDAVLLNQMTKILRIRNPKGPIINEADDAPIYLPKIREWEVWRKTLNTQKV